MAFPTHSGRMANGYPTISVPPDLHATLADMKVHPRQAFHEVIANLVEQARNA